MAVAFLCHESLRCGSGDGCQEGPGESPDEGSTDELRASRSGGVPEVKAPSLMPLPCLRTTTIFMELHLETQVPQVPV